MRRVMFDTNIVLDVLLDRKPHAEASAAAWAAIESGTATGLLAAHAITTIHYLVRKQVGNSDAKPIMAALLKVFGVAAVDGLVIQNAMQLPTSDFEDAVTAAAASAAGCHWIVTRDPKGFRGSPVPGLTPEALTPILCRL